MPGDLPHVREKSPGIFLFISYLMYKERDIYLLAQGLQGDWPSPIAVSVYCQIKTES